MVTLELVTMRSWAERGFTALSLHTARKGEAQLQPSDPSHRCPSHLVQSTREEGANAWAVLGSGLGYLQAPQGWSEPLPQGQAVSDHYNDNLLPDRYYCNSHALCFLRHVSRSKATPRGLSLRESSYLPLPLCCTSLGAWIHSCSSINIKHISLSRRRKLKWQGLWQMLRNVDLFITESQANLLKAFFFLPPPPFFFNVQTSKQWIVASVTATKPCQLKPAEHSLQW